MWTRGFFRTGLFSLGLALSGWLAVAGEASAAPAMCTGNVNPQGLAATHLLAKINGIWVEPSNVCVGARVEENTGIGMINRGLYLGVWNTVDGAFPETHLPPGTPISLGIRRPPGMIFQTTFGRWRNSVVVSEGDETVIQASTVPWDYHHEAYFGGPGLNCALQPARWPSTFTAYVALNPLNPDRTPNLDSARYAGSFYESNTVGAVLPSIRVDEYGSPTGLQVTVSGCGDADPLTHEGYFDGFTPISLFRAFGISDQLLQDTALLPEIVEIRDLTTNSPIGASFAPVSPSALAQEAVPGVTLPSPPAGSEVIGVRTTSTFSYSERVLLQRGRPRAIAFLRRCRSRGGRPAAKHGRLTCLPDAKRPRVKLITRRSLKRGKPLSLSCNEPCTVIAAVRARGKLLAAGRRKSTRAGRINVPLALTAAGRARLASGASVRAVLRLTVRDRAGNTLRLRRARQLTG